MGFSEYSNYDGLGLAELVKHAVVGLSIVQAPSDVGLSCELADVSLPL